MTRKEEPIRPHAFGDTAQIVLSMIQQISRGRVLDIAAGEGFLSGKLKELGFEVTAGDIDPRGFKADGIQCHALDLNQPLPFDGDSFDAVCFLETLEHLRCPGLCLSEIQRVLRPGGKLFLSTPNITALPSRLLFLFTGQFHNFYDTNASCTYENGTDRHILPLPLWLVERHLKHAGLQPREVRYSVGGIEIPRRRRPWFKLVLFPRHRFFGNSAILRATKNPPLPETSPGPLPRQHWQ